MKRSISEWGKAQEDFILKREELAELVQCAENITGFHNKDYDKKWINEIKALIKKMDKKLVAYLYSKEFKKWAKKQK